MLQIHWTLTAYLITLTFLIGAAGGSFINCLSWRLVHGERVAKGRSHCTVCGHVLGVPDLVPVFSWIFLRGKCRYCKAPISSRYMWTEILMGVVAVSLLIRYDLSLKALFYLVFGFILLGESLTDLEVFEIPDGFHLAAILWWCLYLPFSGGSVPARLTGGLLGGAVIAGGILLLTMIFDRILGKESMGGADIKLFFVTGLYLGLLGNLLNLIASCIMGLFFAALSSKARSGNEDPSLIPFGPAIAAGTWFCLLFGEGIITWYTGFF
ncbi:MAG: prepilin peptidase [Clostridium sp.]|nr:prepilin peptidase [Clostridium sp.]